MSLNSILSAHRIFQCWCPDSLSKENIDTNNRQRHQNGLPSSGVILATSSSSLQTASVTIDYYSRWWWWCCIRSEGQFKWNRDVCKCRNINFRNLCNILLLVRHFQHIFYWVVILCGTMGHSRYLCLHDRPNTTDAPKPFKYAVSHVSNSIENNWIREEQ